MCRQTLLRRLARRGRRGWPAVVDRGPGAPPRAPRAPVRVEALERRALLSTVEVSGGTLTVLGTVGNDDITLLVGGGIVTVTVNGVPAAELDALIDEIAIDGQAGDDTIRVKRNSDNAIRVYGGDGDDQILFGDNAGSLSSLGGVQVAIHVEGDAGFDRVELDDTNRVEAATYDLWPADAFVRVAVQDNTTAPLAPLVTVGGVEAVAVLGGSGDDVLRVLNDLPGVAVTLLGGLGDDEIIVNGDGGPAAPVEVDGAAGVDDLWIGPGDVRVRAPGSAEWDLLRVDGGSRLTLGLSDAAVHRARALQVSAAAKLDVGRGTLVVDYAGPADSPIAAVGQLLQLGFAGGTWLGNGLTSSAAGAGTGLAVGYAEAAGLPPAVLLSLTGPGGLATPVDATSVVVRFTLAGDADLSRRVDIADFSRLAAGFNGPARWGGGDFDFDGAAGIADFSALAARFNQALAPPTPARFGALPVRLLPAGGDERWAVDDILA